MNMSPKNDAKYLWTNHVARKMRYYGLSEQRVRRVLRSHQRVEEGVAPKTIAVMSGAGSSKRPHEIWVMYQLDGKKKKIISAWRYPGRSPVGKKIEIPPDVLKDLKEFI
jgi:hypothetical protein